MVRVNNYLPRAGGPGLRLRKTYLEKTVYKKVWRPTLEEGERADRATQGAGSKDPERGSHGSDNMGINRILA